MSIDAYLRNTRLLANQPPDPQQHELYQRYDAFIRAALRPLDADLPPLHVTFSLEARSEILEVEDAFYFVYDQHTGGTLDTLNRLYLNARRNMDAIMVGLRLVAERLLVQHNVRGAFVTAFNYQELAQEHPLTYLEELPENTAHRTLFTTTHEIAAMATVLVDEAISWAIGGSLKAEQNAVFEGYIRQVSEHLFPTALDYSPFQNARLQPIPPLADDAIGLDYVRDTLCTLITLAYLQQETDAAARPAVVRSLDVLMRHRALQDAIERLAAGQWQTTSQLAPRFARRRTNLLSTLKAMRDQYFASEPGVDISDIEATYKQVILAPILQGVFEQVRPMLGNEAAYLKEQDISEELLSVASIAEMVGFRR
jgi:hypothetical protein